MLKIILGFICVLYFVFAGYIIYDGTILLGVVLLIIGLVIAPLALMFSRDGVRVSSAPDPKLYNNSGFGGGGSV